MNFVDPFYLKRTKPESFAINLILGFAGSKKCFHNDICSGHVELYLCFSAYKHSQMKSLKKRQISLIQVKKMSTYFRIRLAARMTFSR